MAFSFLKKIFKFNNDEEFTSKFQPSINNTFGKTYNRIITTFQSKQKKIKSKFNISTEANLILSNIHAKVRKEYLTAAKTYQVLLDTFEKEEQNINKLISHADIKALITDLIELYFLAGSYKKCIEIYEKYHKALQDGTSISIVAHSNLFIKQYSKAIDFYKLYKKLFDSLQDNMHNFYARVKICLAFEDKKKQLRHIEEAIEEEYYLQKDKLLLKPNRQLHIIYTNILKSENKIKKSYLEAKNIIQNDLIRDEEDINLIEEIYSLASKKDEFHNDIKQYYKNNPFMCMAIVNHHISNGFKTSGLQTLEYYLENNGYNIFIAKKYTILSENKILQIITKNEPSFQCLSCGDKVNNYSDECKVCHSFDSIYPITKKG